MEVKRGPRSISTTDESSAGTELTVKFTVTAELAAALASRISPWYFETKYKEDVRLIESALNNKKGNKLVQVKSKPVQVTVEELTLTLDPQEVKCLKFLLEQFEENCYMAEDDGGPEGGEEFKDKLIEVVTESVTRTAAGKSHPN